MLLSSDVLIVDQVTSILRDDFAIKDPHGATLGHIRTEGGIARRMMVGNRQFTVDDSEGNPVLSLKDVMNIGRDRFDVYGPDGARLGEVIKQITLFKPRLTVRVDGGDELSVRGDFFDFNYEVDSDGTQVAKVSRKWPTITGALLGRDRYVIAFASGTPALLRQMVLGTTIALDLIRAKQRDDDD